MPYPVAAARGKSGGPEDALYVAKTGNDSNRGDSASPYLTIAKALTVVAAGQTIYVRAGTYTENLSIPRSGTAGKRITLRGFPGETATIAGGASACIKFLDNYQYWTISDLTFTSTASLNYGAMGSAIEQDSATGVDNLIVERISANCAVILSGANNIIRNNTFNGTGNTTYAINGAIFFRESRTTGLQIYGNTISNWAGRGIWLYQDIVDPQVYNNTIHDITAIDDTHMGINADGYGHESNGGDYYGNVIYNIIGTYGTGITFENGLNAPVARNNLIHDCTRGIGFINYEEDGLDETACNAVVKNNILYHCLNPFNIITAPGLSFFHNTIADCLTADDQNVFYLQGTAAQLAGLVVKGNIYKHNGDGGTSDSIFSFQSDYTILTTTNVAYNDWYHRSTNVVHRRSDWAGQNWAAWTGAGYDANSIESDPLFTDGTNHDYTLQTGSPAKDTATNLGVADDYAGNARPLGAGYDMGAYERA
ncbi:MAG: right-handed parallel beta-helix repeat-containing protein [bacterium]